MCWETYLIGFVIGIVVGASIALHYAGCRIDELRIELQREKDPRRW